MYHLRHLRRLTIVVLVLVVIVFLLTFLPGAINPVPASKEKQEADQRWINTSPSWLDRQACRWLSLCGLLHLKPDPPEGLDCHYDEDHDLKRILDENFGRDDRVTTNYTRELRGIPDYVLNHAPLVHLYSGEYFWPSDIADHIQHVVPDADGKPLNKLAKLTLANLHELSSESGFLHLKSKDDVESRPRWLHSRGNIPMGYGDDSDEWDEWDEWNTGAEDPSSEDTTWFEVDRDHPLHRISNPARRPAGLPKDGQIERRPRAARSRNRRVPKPPATHYYKPDESGYSRAPATLVLVDKGSSVVDAFWFFFYAYNLGQTVLGTRYGNHVGDWEHAMIRFEAGIPRAVFFSEHEGGQAYAWQAVEKRGNMTQTQRPVIYSAVGSHAMYAMPGDHPYVLPFGILKDVTDRGPLWDPSRNFRGYWYDYTATGDAEGFEPVKENPGAPTSWFHYRGRWGDGLYGLDDQRQWRLFGQYHYVAGPKGPKFKNLAREKMCQTWRCRMLHSIAEGRKWSWHS
ncbi:hypothetical protein F5X96DRAFT_341888 [Biscogniauxia mediterranea]|nr:hypothetical protein F5X96DRAFT_341888 [Biscogniauxia mediterranea]